METNNSRITITKEVIEGLKETIEWVKENLDTLKVDIYNV